MGLFLGGFVGFLVIGVPIALALGLACFLYLLLTGNTNLLLAFPQRMIAGIDQFVLLTIPLFLLTGNLMNTGGITDRIVRCAQAIVGRVRGGLAYVNVVASMFFSGVSGSATADSSALGSVLIPAMEREGYDKAFAAALTAVSSVIGPMIPPSIAMIIYGVLSGVPISSLFLAGIIPGLLIGLGLLAYSFYASVRYGHPLSPPMAMGERAAAIGKAVPAMLLPVIILGGILSGAFTPTESAAVAAIYAFLISVFLYRDMRIRDVWKPLADTAIVSSGIMLIVAMASMTAFIFGFENIPGRVATWLLSLTDNPALLLLLINGFLLLLGLFLEPLAAMILMMPILTKLVPVLGIDPLHFGIVVVLNLVIGLATPPVGLCVFVVCAIARLPIEKVARASAPMLAVCVAVLLLVTFVPGLALWVPSWFAE